MPYSKAAPLTSNELNDLQKARLMRSTRKLAAILGTTPHLLDSVDETSRRSDAESFFSSHDSFSRPSFSDARPASSMSMVTDERPTSRASKREGRIFSSSASMSSTSSFASWLSISEADFYESPSCQASVSTFPTFSRSPTSHSKAGSTSSLPLVVKVSLPGLIPEKKTSSRPANPLNLRLNPIPLSPSDTRFALSATSPLLPPTPKSPESMVFVTKRKVVSPADRRKKMAKLYRTLGENVPPHLVFRGSAGHGMARTKGNASDHDDADSDDDDFDDDTECYGDGGEKLMPTPKQAHYSRPPLPSFSRPGQAANAVTHARSMSTPQLLTTGSASLGRRSPFENVRQSTTAFAGLQTRCQTPDSIRSQSSATREGEWNVDDMANVQKALRTLRA